MEYDSFLTEDDVIEMSVDVRTSSPDGIIYFAQQSDGSDVVAVYLKEGRVIRFNARSHATASPRYTLV